MTNRRETIAGLAILTGIVPACWLMCIGGRAVAVAIDSNDKAFLAAVVVMVSVTVVAWALGDYA